MYKCNQTEYIGRSSSSSSIETAHIEPKYQADLTKHCSPNLNASAAAATISKCKTECFIRSAEKKGLRTSNGRSGMRGSRVADARAKLLRRASRRFWTRPVRC